MNNEQFEKSLTRIQEFADSIENRTLEERHKPLLDEIIDFNANPNKHTYDNVLAICQNPLYDSFVQTRYAQLNKDYQKFLHLYKSIYFKHFDIESKLHK